MSTPQDQATDPAAHVTVTLDSCCKEDAQAVLAALQGSFASDRARDDAPGDAPNGRPIVWTATFDVSRTLGLPGPARLTEPVTVTAQGGYHAVDRLRESLAEAFAVRILGTASGDQEEEVTFRLANR
ncbi:hypothetical protein [Streptomyces sp. HPF1205]|uniref:hypothetical protein n=1 Tax=Streptomyces sp. HPF1205 TaxID=2873262 RepID=UPI001CECE4F7|nr:hypothetical protein [Streptomyces sp. HPF1205]